MIRLIMLKASWSSLSLESLSLELDRRCRLALLRPSLAADIAAAILSILASSCAIRAAALLAGDGDGDGSGSGDGDGAGAGVGAGLAAGFVAAAVGLVPPRLPRPPRPPPFRPSPVAGLGAVGS